jgi:hypothetical protein
MDSLHSRADGAREESPCQEVAVRFIGEGSTGCFPRPLSLSDGGEDGEHSRRTPDNTFSTRRCAHAQEPEVEAVRARLAREAVPV